MADPPLDRIHIRDLTVRCIVGINPDEREKEQDVIINLVLHADLRSPGESDAIEDTIDYKTVKNRVYDLVSASRYYLVERLAQRVAAACFEDPRVERVEVTIDKPGALRFARSVAIGIVRDRTNLQAR
jgi:dihydroneopterin aldolase/D-erythro-7,8-dihydroneopterin triphosphate epimerase